MGLQENERVMQDLVVWKSRSSEEVCVLCHLLGMWYLAMLNTSVARGDFTSGSRADVLRSYCTALHFTALPHGAPLYSTLQHSALLNKLQGSPLHS